MVIVEVNGTVKDVANVITKLYNDFEGEVLIVGDGVEEVAASVLKNLQDFKVTYVENVVDEGQYIKIFD